MNNRISIVVKINRSTKFSHHFHLWLDRFPRRTIKIFPLSPIILAVSAQKSARFRILRGENCRVIHPWRVLRFRRNSRERERERERAAISGGVSKRRNDKVATRMVLFVSTFRRGHAVFTVLGVYDALNYPVCNKTRGGTRMTPR